MQGGHWQRWESHPNLSDPHIVLCTSAHLPFWEEQSLDRTCSLHLSFSPPETTPAVQGPDKADRDLPMAELLPLLPGAPLLTQSGDQDSLVPPAECQSQQPQDGRAEDLASEPWRLLEVPSIQITPSSDGESPHCTQALQRLQLPRTPDLESLLQDR